jgi:hypothetical protein
MGLERDISLLGATLRVTKREGSLTGHPEECIKESSEAGLLTP